MKKKGGKILFTAKAYNGRCILSWLADCLLTALDSYPDREVLVLTSAAMTLDLKLDFFFMVLMFFPIDIVRKTLMMIKGKVFKLYQGSWVLGSNYEQLFQCASSSCLDMFWLQFPQQAQPAFPSGARWQSSCACWRRMAAIWHMAKQRSCWLGCGYHPWMRSRLPYLLIKSNSTNLVHPGLVCKSKSQHSCLHDDMICQVCRV